MNDILLLNELLSKRIVGSIKIQLLVICGSYVDHRWIIRGSYVDERWMKGG